MNRIGLGITIGILVFLIVILGVFIFRQPSPVQTPRKSTSTPVPSTSASSSLTPTSFISPSQLPKEKANIVVTSPKANAIVYLPITIKGEARVFENQLNYRFRDVNNTIILEGRAYADSLTAGQFGNYTIQILSLPTMRANAITLEVFDYSAKDGQEIDTVSIPLVFDPANSIPVNTFWQSKQAPAGQECTSVYPSERHVAKTQTPARAALEELLKGPMVFEKDKGYYTSINEGVTVQKLTIESGVAKVDFSKQLNEGVAGSCKVAAIRAQITQTLKQFSGVNDVVISVDGRTEDILQP